ncbi:MAG: SpoIID/LytB domain-containing protein [Acidimicrobiia bacterium]|jgi:stage II sporulation protein D
MREVLAALLLLVVQTPAEPAPRTEFVADTVVITPVEGATVEVGGRRYGGELTVSAHDRGLALVEEVSVDDYLLGIREVPFSWEREALKAQVVAARTYLAWTLAAGRSSAGRRFGYDICATSACQVYAGVDGVREAGGDRWGEAVESTAGEVLLVGGRPAEALYSSTSGGRTRSNEDVFLSSPISYLRAVESPGENSPFVTWSFSLEQDEADLLFNAAGVADGPVRRIATEVRGDGEGPWLVRVESQGATTTIPTWQLRGRLNRAAAEVIPDVLPARRPGSDRRYPQSFLSPSYVIRTELRFVPPQGAPPRFETFFRVEGRGWGHLVGMSQYGAQAMAEQGSDYRRILAHYYGGLVPEAGGGLPATVRVGIQVDVPVIVAVPDGPVTVVIDGQEVAGDVLGTWRFGLRDGLLVAEAPAGLGLPPAVRGPVPLWGPGGVISGVAFTLTAPAEVRVVLETAGVVISGSAWSVRDAGRHEVPLSEITVGDALPDVVRVRIEARNPQGEAAGSFLVIDGTR